MNDKNENNYIVITKLLITILRSTVEKDGKILLQGSCKIGAENFIVDRKTEVGKKLVLEHHKIQTIEILQFYGAHKMI